MVKIVLILAELQVTTTGPPKARPMQERVKIHPTHQQQNTARRVGRSQLDIRHINCAHYCIELLLQLRSLPLLLACKSHALSRSTLKRWATFIRLRFAFDATHHEYLPRRGPASRPYAHYVANASAAISFIGGGCIIIHISLLSL